MRNKMVTWGGYSRTLPKGGWRGEVTPHRLIDCGVKAP